ncbi:hypothetical protein J4Q44_G00210040 [Coregonus suidteri]|uniref:Interleukin 17 receptor C n=1 Tax=Coregonus suidteri TaxID=861788 RepID=A0AAN8LCZ4_9TELE
MLLHSLYCRTEFPKLRPAWSGLTDCSVKDVALPVMKGPVNVRWLELRVILCCTSRHDCKPCLRVQVFFTIKDQHEDQEVSADHGNKDYNPKQKEEGERSALGMPPSQTEASVTLCYSYPHVIDRCKKVTFTLSHSALGDQHSPEMWLSLLLVPVPYGSPVKVYALSTSGTTIIPSLQNVCSPNLDGIVKECDVPRLQAVIDEKRDVAVLKLKSSNETPTSGMSMCQMSGTEELGFCRIQEWQEGQREMIIPLRSIAPCLCFKVWWKGKNLRREICPFMNNKELFRSMWHNNVSVSVEAQTSAENGTALSWNITAPCQLEGELWLCRRDSVGGQCEEVMGTRQRMHNHTHAGWTAALHGHWKRGEFINVNPHPALCVQMKVQGMDTKLDPLICPFATPRNRWSLTLLIGLICLAVLGACVIHGALKGYVWRWLKDDDIGGAVGGSHIVLLYPPDSDQALPGLLCRLGTSLSSLGFSVSVDLWSRTELSVLGPVPWLHSRLDCLQRQGGKVVLVLTQAAWERAEEWGSRGWERDTLRGSGCDEDGEAVEGCRSPYLDVFSASLTCILADNLQGRAGERFTLVQFESLPTQPPGGGRPLPELFRGMQLFSLPSQSLGFLTELALGRGRGAASWALAGGLRAASRALAGGLRGFAGGSAVLQLAGLPQDCVGAGVEDPWESVPLEPCLTTPPSSPDTCTKTSGMDWV